MELNTIIYFSVTLVTVSSLIVIVASYFISRSKNITTGLTNSEKSISSKSDEGPNAAALDNHLSRKKIISNEHKPEKVFESSGSPNVTTKSAEEPATVNNSASRMKRIDSLTNSTSGNIINFNHSKTNNKRYD